MKVIKPLNLSYLYKVFEARQSFFYCGAIIGMFPFSDPERLFPDPLIWKTAGEELGKNAVLDMVMPKPVGEVLVTGQCHAGRKPVTGKTVRLRLGTVDKTLVVTGDRHWVKAGGVTVNISEAEPFLRMPMTYERAFGGAGYDLNPLGKGAASILDAQGKTIHPLPNIESPAEKLSGPNDRPRPAGFGPLDMTWPQRLPKAGTYDQEWQKTLFPGLAADIDMHFFNLAPEDQWLDAYFQGDETFSVAGMHPEQETVASSLPGFRTRMFIKRKVDEEERFFEIQTKLDTVWLFPHAEKAIMIWHGTAEIDTDDATDVIAGLAAYERLNDEPRSPGHYAEAMAKRFDKHKKDFYDLYDKDLVPPDAKSGWAALMAQGQKDDRPLARNMKRKAALEKEKSEALLGQYDAKIKGMLEKYGVDPALCPSLDPGAAEPEMPNIDLENFDPEQILQAIEDAEAKAEEMKAKALADAETQKADAEKAVRDICEKYKIDADQYLAQARAQEPKRPILMAGEQIDKIRAARAQIEKQLSQAAGLLGLDLEGLRQKAEAASEGGENPIEEALEKLKTLNPDDPDFIAKMEQAETMTRRVYREHAQRYPNPAPSSSDTLAEHVQLFESIRENGGSFHHEDLAGIDLSGRDLSGLNLSGAYLEGVNLENANLTGADLTEAVLAHAHLAGAVLNNARLAGTNMGRADLTGARFEKSDLTKAVLAEANLTGTMFLGCKMAEAELADAVIEQTDFSESNLQKVMLVKAAMSGASFCRANLTQATLIKPVLKSVDFTDARARNITFIGLTAEDLTFNRADLTNARFLGGIDLSGARFQHAILDKANLMNAKLEGVSLAKAEMNQANLMGADLREADLTGAVAKTAVLSKANLEKAKLVGTNLMEANLKGARLVAADLRMANLYSAEVFRCVLGETRLEGTNLKMTKIQRLEQR